MIKIKDKWVLTPYDTIFISLVVGAGIGFVVGYWLGLM